MTKKEIMARVHELAYQTDENTLFALEWIQRYMNEHQYDDAKTVVDGVTEIMREATREQAAKLAVAAAFPDKETEPDPETLGMQIKRKIWEQIQHATQIYHENGKGAWEAGRVDGLQDALAAVEDITGTTKI